jgi:hypothetical protein
MGIPGYVLPSWRRLLDGARTESLDPLEILPLGLPADLSRLLGGLFR